MVYSRRNSVQEQDEAHQRANQITAICETLHITLDPIDWQNLGMLATISVNGIKISDLLDLRQQDSDSVLRRFQAKLFEHAALEAIHAQPDSKALIWSPVDVVQPQEFLNLWVITIETDERVAIAEYIKNGQRVYEQYESGPYDRQHLIKLFGPLHEGEYQLHHKVTVEEYGRKYIGEIIHIIPPNKTTTNHKYAARGYHTISGKSYTNNASARYIVDCQDGFPHVVSQSQVSAATSDDTLATVQE